MSASVSSPLQRNVTLVFHKACDKMPEIENNNYKESALCIFLLTYGRFVIGTLRQDFAGYWRVWTSYNENSFSFHKDVREWAYCEEMFKIEETEH